MPEYRYCYFEFYKEWAVEKCTETPFKMFWKPRNEQNESGYFFLKHPVGTIILPGFIHYFGG